jgi:hypothetical protein
MKKILILSKKFYSTLTNDITKITIEGNNEDQIKIIVDILKKFCKGFIREVSE